jgi:cytochrome c biogenesis protein ResB
MKEEFVKKSTESPAVAVPAAPSPSLLATLDRWILKGWKAYTSLKFGIFLLALIGIAAVYGTMGYASNAALGDNSITMARTHFFESGGFVALLVLFAVNLVFSTWHVTKMSFQIWGKREFRRGATYYEHGSSPRAVIELPGGIAAARATLAKRFPFLHWDGNALFAHKGLLSRLGPTIVHAGMIIVIGSIVVKAWLLWNDRIVAEARFIAAEGETSDLIHAPQDLAQTISDKNRLERSTGLHIRVLDFDEIKHPNSEVPAYFSSLVEVRDPRTNQITVAQLDMNHSLKLETALGDLQFHQAGYQALPESDIQRVNFDVRDAKTGERIAVTDAHAGTRVRVGDSDLFLEVDGVGPAERWRIYSISSPTKPLAEGLLSGNRKLRYSFKPLRFFTHFTIDEATKAPANASPEIVNPALEVGLFLDDRQVETTWLFADKELAAAVPPSHPKFQLALSDVRFRPDLKLDAVQWNTPGEALFVITLTDRESGKELGQEVLAIGEASTAVEYESKVDHGTVAATNGPYEVRILGPTTRFLTVLSVVNEPTVFWTNLGVALIVLGAMMTFAFRYRALYGLWDETSATLRLALVPRWGQSAAGEELDALVKELGGVRVKPVAPEATAADEVLPAHETVNPLLGASRPG